MAITYSDSKELDKDKLQNLFLSVQWSSGNYPDQLQIAMRNSDMVISAWDGDKLVGLINALSDGIMNVYFHYLLVRPNYQSKGLGTHLLLSMLNEYKDYARISIFAYDDKVPIYEKFGFEISQGRTPMCVTYLTT